MIYLRNQIQKTVMIITRFGLLLPLFIVSCGTGKQTPTIATTPISSTVENETTSYPYPPSDSTNVVQGDELPYPSPSESSKVDLPYPAPEGNSEGILLAFDRPIKTTDTVVTGVGPPGVAVTIIDITFMGTELGSGVIKEDGTFSIDVNGLQSGIRIGLFADISFSGFSEEDVTPGEGVISIPRVGFFYDSVVLD